MLGSRKSKRSCVFDLEGNGLLRTCTRIWCGVFIDTRTSEKFKFGPDDMPAMKEFMDTCDTLIAHNGLGYDFPVLEKVLGYEYKGTKVDTLIMSRLLYHSISKPKGCRGGPHSVEAWGVRFGRAKPDHEDWSVYTPEMLHRCSEDTEIQLQLYSKLVKKMKLESWPKRTFDLTFKLFEIFQKQEEYGWLFDTEYAKQSVQALTRWIEKIDTVLTPYLPMRVQVNEQKVPRENEYKHLKQIFLKSGKYSKNTLAVFPDAEDTKIVAGPFTRISFRRTNIASDKEVKEYLLSEGWKPKEYNYKKDPDTGRPAKDDSGNPIRTSPKLSADDPFVGVNGRVGTLLARRVKCVHRRSVLEGLIESTRDDGRISQTIAGIAVTGRLKHGGIVNMPGNGSFFGTRMRKCFISKPGYSIIGTDASSCQDRMLAARANHPEFTRMLLEGNQDEGTDGHSLARDAINAVLRRNNLPLITRKIAKNFNYGWKFGASDNKLAKMSGGTKDVGAQIRVALQEVFPAQAELIERLTDEWKRSAEIKMNPWGKLQHANGTISGLDGRPIKIASEHQILVYMLQSDEAITMQYATCFLYKWATERGWEHGKDWGFVANVHDEYQCEVRDDLIPEFKELAERSIEYAGNVLKLAVPQRGEADVGRNWLETH